MTQLRAAFLAVFDAVGAFIERHVILGAIISWAAVFVAAVFAMWLVVVFFTWEPAPPPWA